VPRRPRALMLAPAIPARTGNGLAMRLGIFLEALARVAEVDLVVPAIAGRPDASWDLPASLGVMMGAFPADQIMDTRFKMILRLKDPVRRIEAFREYQRPSFAAAASGSLLAYMGALGRERTYDLVHVGRGYMAEAGLAAAGEGTRLSLDLDEDDYVSLRTIAELPSDGGRDHATEWLRIEADASDRMVARLAPKFDRLWISSLEDRETLMARHPALAPELIRNAVEYPPRPARRDDGSTLFFVGSFGYPPNVGGILWFASEVWPRLKARAGRPLRTVVVGADAPRPVIRLGRKQGWARLLGGQADFSVLGRVANLRPLYETATLAIAPVKGGRGTRIKMLEAAAEAVPIVATSDAARGLPLDPPWAWIADDADGFADACLAALHDREERALRAQRGRELVAAQYDRARVVNDLAAHFSEFLSGEADRRRDPTSSAHAHS
jgi:polysaccharide biosynthesis protein PslH